MKIIIETIRHEDQRYITVGDWFFEKDGTLRIKVSDMKNWKYEFLVAYHELIEVMLCKDRKISQKSVDSFDINFEKEREQGKHGLEDEPGDDPKAPYRKEHFFATNIERLTADELGVNWEKYNDTVVNL